MRKTLLSGYEMIDKDFGGLRSGEVTLIGGRPFMGKTALALQIALNVAESGKKVLFISEESSPVELELRLISIISNISIFEIKRWNLTDFEWEVFKSSARKIKGLPIRFCSAESIKKIKYLLKEETCSDLIIYDYLQLIHKDSEVRSSGTPDFTPVEFLYRFKKIAKHNNIPVIVLSQLSRKPDKRKDKHPKIKDIRVNPFSKDAYDQAILLYREYYYDKMASRNKAEFLGISNTKKIKKTCEMFWNDNKNIFEDYREV